MVPGHIPQMKSQNFEFLRPKRAVLADLAGFAEQYAHSDPAGSLGKQRGFGINLADLRMDQILLPSRVHVERFERAWDGLELVGTESDNGAARSEQLFDSLAHRAFSGESA